MRKGKYILLVSFVVFIASQCTEEKNITGPALLDDSRYNFESGLTDGWVVTRDADSRAINKIANSSSRSAVGDYSLKINARLLSGSTTYTKGEAYVDMRKNKPFGIMRIPLDLNKKTITLWVYTPAALKGEFPSSPNGIQFFLRDIDYNNWYSLFLKVGTDVATNSWSKLEIPVTTDAGTYGYKDEEFNPGKIIIMGVKIGTAGDAVNVNETSSFYIDSISWK